MRTHIALLAALLLLIPLTTAALVPEAEQQGYHDTTYTNELRTANTTVSSITAESPVSFRDTTRIQGGLQMTGGVFNTYQDLRVLRFFNPPALDVDAGNGNVGIGAYSTATERLYVDGDILATGDINADGQICDTNGCIGSGGGTPPVWSQNGNDAYYTTGNVGIGFSSPGAPLDIRRSSGDNGPILQLRGASNNVAASFGLITGAYDPQGTATLNLRKEIEPGGSNTNYVNLQPDESFIDSVRVGVGTTNPNAQFHVDGDVLLEGTSGLLKLKSTNDADYLYTQYADSNDNIQVWTGLDAGLTNYRISLQGDTENIVLEGGNVGVGTDSPSGQLDVQGVTVLNGTVGIGTSEPRMQAEIIGNAYFSEYTPTNRTGPVVRSPDGNCWVLGVDNNGDSSHQAVNCPGLTIMPPKFLAITGIYRDNFIGSGVGDAEVRLDWSAPSVTTGLDSYNIYDSDGFVANIPSSQTQYTHLVPNLDRGDNLEYEVRSVTSSLQESTADSFSYTVQYGAPVYDSATNRLYCKVEQVIGAGQCINPRSTAAFEYISGGDLTPSDQTPTAFCDEQGFSGTGGLTQVADVSTSAVKINEGGPVWETYPDPLVPLSSIEALIAISCSDT